MKDQLEYIDNYFKKILSPEERNRFEQMILNDPSFAEEVAFYYAAMHTSKEQLADEKKKRFKEIYHEEVPITKVVPISSKKTYPLMAAAAIVVLMITGWFLFYRTEPPQKMADQYIHEHLRSLEVTMSAKPDSIQMGIQLYNDKNYESSLSLFESILKRNPANAEAIKYAGIVSLQLQQFDKAINYFSLLENNHQLFSNPGKFYHAIALLKRNGPDDITKAKKLMEEVIEKKLDEQEPAKKILEKL